MLIENNEIIVQSLRIPISRGFREEVVSQVIEQKAFEKGG